MDLAPIVDEVSGCGVFNLSDPIAKFFLKKLVSPTLCPCQLLAVDLKFFSGIEGS